LEPDRKNVDAASADVMDLGASPADPQQAAILQEERRLAVLHRSGILDTAPEQNFDDLTALAAQVCDMPLALVAFIDRERLWFKSCFGGNLKEYPRARSFCDHALRAEGVLEVPDLSRDERFKGEPLVTEAGFRFYASAHIKSRGGEILGTLSVLDWRPRQLTEAQRAGLMRLGAQGSAQIALRELLRDRDAELANQTHALQSTEARLRAFLQHAPITMSVKDLAGRYLMVNRASEMFYGRSADEMIGRRITDFESSAGGATIDEMEDEMRRTGQPVMREISYERVDGKRWYREIKFPILDAQGHLVAIGGVGVEITAVMRAQEELTAAKENAEAANQAKSQFLANMSHELRTPLNAILGFSEILAGNPLGPMDDARIRAYAGDIHQSGQLLMEIINDILDLSKIEAGRMVLTTAPCSFHDIAENALNLVARAAGERNLALNNALPESLPKVLGDERALTQILLNLINNAVKFTPPGGEITVSGGLINQGEVGDGIAISVIDTGIGIASKDIPLVFSAFGRVEDAFIRTHEGTGLGLPIARALAEAQGGKLDLHSRLGAGTRVTLWLPKERIIAG
jgi:PAS domain S-box-containing protein